MNNPLIQFSELYALSSQCEDFVPAQTDKRPEDLLISASNDLEAIQAWLMKYRNSKNTLASARTVSARLLEWLTTREPKLSFKDMKFEDAVAFLDFLKNPLPRDYWVIEDPKEYEHPTQEEIEKSGMPPAPKKKRLPRKIDGAINPMWRPFVHGLSEGSIELYKSHCNNLMNFMVDAGYINRNPFRLMSSSGKIKPKVERFLSMETVLAIIAFLKIKSSSENQVEKRNGFRQRFVFSLFYYTGLRISEATSARMRDIRKIDGRWWIKVIGKGRKEDIVPLPESLIQELMLYREHLGLDLLPTINDNGPLIQDVYGKGKPITVKAVDFIFKQIFSEFSNQCEDEQMKMEVEQATPHFMRHTCASHQLNHFNIPLTMVRDNLRHGNIQTTNRYSHVERNMRHESTNNMKV